MNTVIIIDKKKAEQLSALGFRYKAVKVGERFCYEFFGTHELLTELNKNYEKTDYVTRKTTNL